MKDHRTPRIGETKAKKIHYQDRLNFLSDYEYLGAKCPGPGSYTPRVYMFEKGYFIGYPTETLYEP